MFNIFGHDSFKIELSNIHGYKNDELYLKNTYFEITGMKLNGKHF